VRRYFIILFICGCTLILSQGVTHHAVSAEDNVVHCQTLEDIEQAKKKGAIYIEKSGYYFVRLGSEYKGPYRQLDTAKKLYLDFQQKASMQGLIANEKGVYNPRLIIDPFVREDQDKKILFTIPGGESVPAAKVMIHPEPLEFEELTFGKINLKAKGDYFAVTGHITIPDTIPFTAADFTVHVGATVIGKAGAVLWQNYGPVEKNLDFKNIAPLTATTTPPEHLLLFTIAKGKLPKMLSNQKGIQPINAVPYDYHVLCSAILEIDATWFPPIEEMAKEEYDRMMKEFTDDKMKKIKRLDSMQ
jgi:hypothetical protein